MSINKLFLLFLLLTTNLIFAQSKYKFGVETGYSYKKYRGTDIFENTSIKPGYLIGFSVDFKLNDKFSIKSGFRYERSIIEYNNFFTTARIEQTDDGGDLLVYDKFFVKTINKYFFYTLPVVLKYKLTNKNPYFIDFGIFVSKIYRDNEHSVTSENRNLPYYTNVNNVNYQKNFTLEDKISNLDYGVIFGFGKTFTFTKSELSIELIDNLGIYNLLDPDRFGGQNTDLKSNTVNLILNYSFNL